MEDAPCGRCTGGGPLDVVFCGILLEGSFGCCTLEGSPRKDPLGAPEMNLLGTPGRHPLESPLYGVHRRKSPKNGPMEAIPRNFPVGGALVGVPWRDYRGRPKEWSLGGCSLAVVQFRVSFRRGPLEVPIYGVYSVPWRRSSGTCLLIWVHWSVRLEGF
jgi:hypothetical protein